MESKAGIKPSPGSTKKPFDYESSKGRFGWVEIGGDYFPIVFRTTDNTREMYVSVRMMETRFLSTLLHVTPPDVISCNKTISYYMTEAESKLLSEINFKHADCYYGTDAYVPKKDVVLKYVEAIEFVEFLNFYFYFRDSTFKMTAQSRCGFFRINRSSVVVYSLVEGVRLVPLFFFEPSLQRLLSGRTQVHSIHGWNLAYLKLCCLDQGILNDALSAEAESCQAVALDEVKAQLRPDIEEFWPTAGFFAASGPAHANLSLFPPFAGPNGSQAPQTSTPDAYGSARPHLGAGSGSSPMHVASASMPTTSNPPAPVRAAAAEEKATPTAASEAKADPSKADPAKSFPASLIPLDEYPVSEAHTEPYKLQRLTLQQKSIKVINLHPYAFTNWMMTFPDFVQHSCSDLSTEDVLHILQVKLNIPLYQGNSGHQALLSTRRVMEMDPVPLLLVKDVMRNSPRLASYIKEAQRAQKRS